MASRTAIAGVMVLLSSLFLLQGQARSAVAATAVSSQDDIAHVWKGHVDGGLVVPVKGQPFKTAVSFINAKAGAHPWDSQAGLNPQAAVGQGDVLLATFYIRASSPASGGLAAFNVSDSGPKYLPSIFQNIAVTSKWKKISLPFVAKAAYAAGKWQYTFQLGSKAQTIEIGGFKLVDFGKSVNPASLPKSGM